jgi:hypothetical protein
LFMAGFYAPPQPAPLGLKGGANRRPRLIPAGKLLYYAVNLQFQP